MVQAMEWLGTLMMYEGGRVINDLLENSFLRDEEKR